MYTTDSNPVHSGGNWTFPRFKVKLPRATLSTIAKPLGWGVKSGAICFKSGAIDSVGRDIPFMREIHWLELWYLPVVRGGNMTQVVAKFTVRHVDACRGNAFCKFLEQGWPSRVLVQRIGLRREKGAPGSWLAKEMGKSFWDRIPPGIRYTVDASLPLMPGPCSGGFLDNA
jgi:hypothetical protein